jgi:hypothetical protein
MRFAEEDLRLLSDVKKSQNSTLGLLVEQMVNKNE